MQYPLFFECVESIVLKDPLSAVLGTFENGLIEFTYLDIVKNAGHSCPTVAGAYLMSATALEALYPDSTPVRGEIEIFFKESQDEGVAGVIGNVISHITGATQSSGFKGLNGKFARDSLMHFSADVVSSAQFRRKDTGKTIDVYYNPNAILPAATMQPLMQKIMQGVASDTEKKEFAVLWQARVEKILCSYHDDEDLVKVIEVS